MIGEERRTERMITLNGQPWRVPPPSTLAAVLEDLGVQPDERGIAVAVNGAVVPRSEWADVRLQAGDWVEVLRAVQGG